MAEEGPDEDIVTRRDREDLVLEFFVEQDIALPPAAVYRGLKRHYRITFTYKTTRRIMRDLAKEDFLMRCDSAALDDGRMEPLPDDAEDRRTYYFITDQGRERIGADQTDK